jgi:glycosyltransferase involved in cell wall biosynthesis
MLGYSHLITHINFAKGFRGGERQTLLLIEELSRRGYSQRVVTRQKSELANRLKKVPNLEIVKARKPYIFSLYKIKDSSLLHAHETKAAQFAYFAKLKYSIPYIVTRRVDIDIKNNFFNKKIYLNSLFTVVLSSAIKKRVHSLDGLISTKIIPSCYTNFSYNKNEIENIKKRFQGKFLIGNIGALEYSKGQDLIIELAKRFEQQYPEIHFIFLGKGKDEEEFKKLAQGLSNITFEGFVNNVGDYIKCFNLFVFPTLSEGFGSILLDIMQGKVPIVASNTGGIPDIITNRENGILFKPKEKEKLFLAIEELYLDKKLAQKLSNKAFENIDKFSLSNMTNSYERIYKGL